MGALEGCKRGWEALKDELNYIILYYSVYFIKLQVR